ncbi:MAG: hypothetical protein ACREGL_11375, partial [Alphaproteobacteria bacterium]
MSTIKPTQTPVPGLAGAPPPNAIVLGDLPAELKRLLPGAVIAGTVVGHSAEGLTLLRTSHGRLAMTLPVAL